MWPAIGYRPLQAVLVTVLSGLVTTCAVFAPLYDRAVQQAAAAVRLADEQVQTTGLQVTSQTPTNGSAYDHERLVQLVPAGMRSHFQAAVDSSTLAVTRLPDTPGSITTGLLWRSGMCRHVTFTEGGCPRRAFDVAISTADAKNFGYRPGRRIAVHERLDNPVLRETERTPPVRLRIVGVYSKQPGDYWFGLAVTGLSGTRDFTGQPRTDRWLISRATLDGGPGHQWVAPTNTVDLSLARDRAGVSELLSLGPAVERFLGSPAPQPEPQGMFADDSSAYVVAHSGLTDVADAVERDREQAHRVVPLLMVQLGLLAVVVLWLVLGAAMEQRRPELAVARLRGRGIAGARALVLRELLAVVLAGVPLGVAAALALSFAARHLWFPLAPPFELGRDPVLALALAVVALVGLTVASTHRVVREPVAALLRTVPPRRSGWALGVADAVVIAISATAVVAFGTGGLRGPIALAAPTLLALMVGLVLSHLVVPSAALGGRRLLANGRTSSGIGLLQIARAPGTRRVIAIITVATALLVFSVDSVVVGARNRGHAAEQEVGAAVVEEVRGADLAAVRRALREVDPGGRIATPVARVDPPGSGGATTQAVVPGQFRRIALFPGQSASTWPWDRLAAPGVPPVRVVGTSLRFRLRSTVVERGSATVLGARLIEPSGSPVLARLAELRPGGGSRTVRAAVPCRVGCDLVGLELGGDRPRVRGRIQVTSMTSSTGQSDLLGPASHWTASARDATSRVSPRGSTAPATLAIEFDLRQSQPGVLTHASVPARAPAIVSGVLPAGSVGDDFTGYDLAGVSRSMRRVAVVPRIPGAPRDTNLVNLDVLSRDVAPGAETTLSIWFAGGHPDAVAQVRKALRKRGVVVATASSVREVRDRYDDSAVAWSLQLAILVGGAGLLIAALVLLVVTATTWRVRSRDLAALRMTGVPVPTLQAVAVLQQAAPIVVATVTGTVCGVIGAHYSLPAVPLFASAPQVSTLDLHTAWWAVLAAAVLSLTALLLIAAASGRWLVRRAALEILKEAT